MVITNKSLTKPDFRKENLWQKIIQNMMTIIRVINVHQGTLATVGKHNSVAHYVNTMVVVIVKTVTRWIYKQDIKGVIKTKKYVKNVK